MFFDKDLFRLMKNAVFWKNNGKCGKTEILNLAQHKEEGTTQYLTQIIILQIFSQCISNRIEKTEIRINKPVYLGLSVLALSEVLMYEF